MPGAITNACGAYNCWTGCGKWSCESRLPIWGYVRVVGYGCGTENCPEPVSISKGGREKNSWGSVAQRGEILVIYSDFYTLMNCPSTICILVLKVLDSVVDGQIGIHYRRHHHRLCCRFLLNWLLIRVPRDISFHIIRTGRFWVGVLVKVVSPSITAAHTGHVAQRLNLSVV